MLNHIQTERKAAYSLRYHKIGGRPLGIGKTTFFVSVEASWGICFFTPKESVLRLTSAFTFVRMETRL